MGLLPTSHKYPSGIVIFRNIRYSGIGLTPGFGDLWDVRVENQRVLPFSLSVQTTPMGFISNIPMFYGKRPFPYRKPEEKSMMTNSFILMDKISSVLLITQILISINKTFWHKSALFHLNHVYIFQVYLLLDAGREKSGKIRDFLFKATECPGQVPPHSPAGPVLIN